MRVLGNWVIGLLCNWGYWGYWVLGFWILRFLGFGCIRVRLLSFLGFEYLRVLFLGFVLWGFGVWGV